MFLFDNADEASLLWANQQRPWYLEITDFIHRQSGLAPFHAVIAARTALASLDADDVVKLDRLTTTGRDKMLTLARVKPTDIDALALDKSLDWYLTNPTALGLLAPTLAGRTWTNSDTVHEAMGDAIDRLLQQRPSSRTTDPNSLLASATAAVAFLNTHSVSSVGGPESMGDVVAHVASARSLSEEEISGDLAALADCGVLNVFLVGMASNIWSSLRRSRHISARVRCLSIPDASA